MHLWVDPELNIRQAHALAHQVKDRIREKLPSVQDVLIHLEPDEEQ
jgi:divalent metal cation (Fe/Co/Zn/Cd) transporter